MFASKQQWKISITIQDIEILREKVKCGVKQTSGATYVHINLPRRKQVYYNTQRHVYYICGCFQPLLFRFSKIHF